MHRIHPHPRKWPLATKIAVIGAVGVVALLTSLALQLVVNVPRTSEVMQKTDIVQHFEISYPTLKADKTDASLKAFADQQIADFVAKIKDKPYDPKNKLTLQHSVQHAGERTVSVIFDKREEIVGQEAVSSQYMLNFDNKSGKKLTFNDIFRPDTDARAVLAKILHDYFKENSAAGLTGEQLQKLTSLKLEDVRDFLVYQDVIAIYLNPKNLADKATAQPIQLHRHVVASVVQDTYAQSDPASQPDSPLTPTFVISELPRPPQNAQPAAGGGRIALTFDDGPSAHTGRLLDALAQHQARATFYVLGHLADDYSGELQRMVRDGHEIGNHTWMHANLTHLDGAAFHQQIGDSQRAIQAATGGYTPRTFRPPYGATNDAVKAQASVYGLHEVLWNVDPNDWQIHNSQLVYDHIMGGAADGRVILLHDIYGSSVDAAIRAIADLKSRGFQLVTASELYGF